MKTRMHEHDLALAHRMLELGVPFELDEAPSGGVYPARQKLLISQAGGPLESTAIDLSCGGTGYIIDLEIASNIPRLVVIREFCLNLPWQDPNLLFLSDTADRGARPHLYVLPGTKIEYPRELVLNHRVSSKGGLRRGETMEGLLLAVGFTPIPDRFHHGDSVGSTVSVVDQFGYEHSSEIVLWIDRSAKIGRHRSKAIPSQVRSRSGTRLPLWPDDDALPSVGSGSRPSGIPAANGARARIAAPVRG